MIKILRKEGMLVKDLGVHKDVMPCDWQPTSEEYEYVVVPWDYDADDLSDLDSKKICTLTMAGVFFHRKPLPEEL